LGENPSTWGKAQGPTDGADADAAIDPRERAHGSCGAHGIPEIGGDVVSADPLNVSLPPEFLEAVAQRAAEILAERQGEPVADDGYLDVDGAAAFLACGKGRIYDLVSARRIPVHRDGSRLLFDRGELRRWVLEGGAKRP
jgi:excisionase family DNA binding protein